MGMYHHLICLMLTSQPSQREFCRLLLPIISRKLRRSIPALLPHPPLLAHTVYQALSFDEALKEAGFSLIGTLEKSKDDLSTWEGTSDIILESNEWFDAWLEGERKCKSVNMKTLFVTILMLVLISRRRSIQRDNLFRRCLATQ